MTGTVQPGIYHEPGSNPAPAFQLLLLNAHMGSSTEIQRALERVFNVLHELRSGCPPDLKGQPQFHAKATTQMFGEVDALIGYGRRCFDNEKHAPPLTAAPRPEYLSYVGSQSDPFPSLQWHEEARGKNRGEADIALQLTGPTQGAVSATAVEVWKTIHDENLPLTPCTSFGGFSRVDGRGWLDFHDGVSNMDSRERPLAIEAAAPDWMTGGSYMAFLRILVDLKTWRALSRSEQELVVGRDRLTGAALADIEEDASGKLVPIPRPFHGKDASAEEQVDWRDPPETLHRLLEASHVHRVNQTRASPGAPGALRMFRQGYEFLEDIGPDGPVLGLNFVSFQSDLRTLQHVMHLPGWLGDVNFGGSSEGELQAPRFLTLAAAGFYAVPPRESPFPGVSLFRARQ